MQEIQFPLELTAIEEDYKNAKNRKFESTAGEIKQSQGLVLEEAFKRTQPSWIINPNVDVYGFFWDFMLIDDGTKIDLKSFSGKSITFSQYCLDNLEGNFKLFPCYASFGEKYSLIGVISSEQILQNNSQWVKPSIYNVKTPYIFASNIISNRIDVNGLVYLESL
jgi:hypothetical protein